MSLSSRSAFISGFSMIFLSEWGDKTQIASALFATEYDPHMVLTGVMMALFLLSLMPYIWEDISPAGSTESYCPGRQGPYSCSSAHLSCYQPWHPPLNRGFQIYREKLMWYMARS